MQKVGVGDLPLFLAIVILLCTLPTDGTADDRPPFVVSKKKEGLLFINSSFLITFFYRKNFYGMTIRAYENFDGKQRLKGIELVRMNSDRLSYCGSSDVYIPDSNSMERWEIPQEMREEFMRYYSL